MLITVNCFNIVYFLECFIVNRKTERKVIRFSIDPLIPRTHSIKISHQICAFVTVDEPTLTHYYHPKTIVLH